MAKESKLILVIEDEPEMVWALRIQIEGSGFKFISAPDGETGWKKVQSEKPDLVLLDLILPGMDGYKVCRLMKDSDKTKHIPVIMLTAKDQVMDMQKGLDLGADHYITKPYDPERLVDTIRKCFERNKNE